jgi:cytochrome c peroxidase
VTASRRLAGLGFVLLLNACKEPDESDRLFEVLRTAAARPAPPPVSEKHNDINPRLLRRFEPLRSQIESSENSITTAKVELGRMLFFEKRLSRQQDLSCNSCHDLAHYGVDGQKTSLGTHGALGARNSPTVYNAAGFFAEFWDGRASTVEAQAVGPILNPLEMSLPNAEHGVRVLKSMPDYVAAFKSAFPADLEPVTFANVGRAIGAFERKLTTPSRWDDYLRGNESALTESELAGLKLFTNIGCMVCHTGEFVGGSMYQKVGVVEPWPNQQDQGRFEATKQDVDRMMFKVPTLRNVTMTGPYFHDGSVPTLNLAVLAMGKHQLGLHLLDSEVTSIVAWLGSLTGELPQQYVRAPALPPSSPNTPGPLP